MRQIFIVLGIIMGSLLIPTLSKAEVIEVCSDCQFKSIKEAIKQQEEWKPFRSAKPAGSEGGYPPKMIFKELRKIG